jgi:transposase-like protein
MTTERLAVRIDPEQKKKLVEMAGRGGISVSDVVRKLIDEAYEVDLREWRHQLVREMAALIVEDVPDPDELSRQLAAKYDFERIC